jgi:hypothetical protein
MTATLKLLPLVLIALASAIVLWLAGAGSAVAPEPARLTSTMSTSVTPAIYVYQQTNTSVLRWPSSYTYANADIVARGNGSPCTNYSLPEGAQTTQVLYLVKSTYNWYARCM